MSEDFKKIASIVVPYSLLCAFLNLYYYWKPFGVQPFEFISIGEVLSYAVPFLMFSVFMLVPVFVCEYLWPSKYLPESKGRNGELYIRFLVGLIAALNIAIVLLAELEFWFGPAILVGIVGGIIPGAFRLSSSRRLTKYFYSKSARAFVCLVVCCLPTASITYALMKRAAILERSEYRTISSSDLSGSSETGNLVYVGHLGEYVFVVRGNENVAIAYRLTDFKKFELGKKIVGRT